MEAFEWANQRACYKPEGNEGDQPETCFQNFHRERGEETALGDGETPDKDRQLWGQHLIAFNSVKGNIYVLNSSTVFIPRLPVISYAYQVNPQGN